MPKPWLSVGFTFYLANLIFQNKFFKYKFIYFNWRLTNLQYCSGFAIQKNFFNERGCCFSVAKTCPTLCDPMDCSMPNTPVLHYLLEFAQIHVHWVSDAIQPFHPLLPPFPPVLNLSQHQGFFPVSQLFPSCDQNIGASASVSVLPINIQGWFP